MEVPERYFLVPLTSAFVGLGFCRLLLLYGVPFCLYPEHLRLRFGCAFAVFALRCLLRVFVLRTPRWPCCRVVHHTDLADRRCR